MTNIVSPHDRIFKSSLSDVRVARDFFNAYLKPEILQSVDLNALELCPQTYIDTELKLSQSDVLYKTMIQGQPGYLFLLLEHQSKPDKFMPFRMLKYHIGIWDDHLKQMKEKGAKDQNLPLIVSLVFYNGREPYTYSCDIKDLINAPMDLIEHVWGKPFKLVDAHTVNDEDLRQHIWSAILAFFMKNIYERDFLPYLQQSLEFLKQLEQAGARDYVVSLLNYALNAGETQHIEQFVEIVKDGLSSEAGETVMTIAEQLMERGKKTGIELGMQQGMQQGMQRGLRQGEARVFMHLIKMKFPVIAEKYISLIEQADEETILEWTDRTLNAESLRDIFGK